MGTECSDSPPPGDRKALAHNMASLAKAISVGLSEASVLDYTIKVNFTLPSQIQLKPQQKVPSNTILAPLIVSGFVGSVNTLAAEAEKRLHLQSAEMFITLCSNKITYDYFNEIL